MSSLPPLAIVGAACTKCGFVGKALFNPADAKKELAQLGALFFGGLTAGTIAYAATPYKQGELCPGCQVPGNLVPITSVLARPALEKNFGPGATVGHYLLQAEGFLPLTFKGRARMLTLTAEGVSVRHRYQVLARAPILSLTFAQLRAVKLMPPRVFTRPYFSLRLVPTSPTPLNPLKALFYLDPHELRFAGRMRKAASVFADAFAAMKTSLDAD